MQGSQMQGSQMQRSQELPPFSSSSKLLFKNPRLPPPSTTTLNLSSPKNPTSFTTQTQRRTTDNAETFERVGTSSDVECVVVPKSSQPPTSDEDGFLNEGLLFLENPVVASPIWDSALLASPFFFRGTAMVAMKEVLPKMGPFFVSLFRLIPAGALLIGFAMLRGRKQPSRFQVWLSILLFGAVDVTCFQVIIDSQPLTVAILAILLFVHCWTRRLNNEIVEVLDKISEGIMGMNETLKKVMKGKKVDVPSVMTDLRKIEGFDHSNIINATRFISSDPTLVDIFFGLTHDDRMEWIFEMGI